MNAVDLALVVLGAALWTCVPVVLAGLGEIVLQRTGGFNIGVEGTMLVGAVTGVLGSAAGGFWTGLATGALGGLLMGAVLALATVVGRAEIVVVGVALNLVGLGLSTYLFQVRTSRDGSNVVVATQPELRVPLLTDLPLLGPALGAGGTLVLVALGLAALVAVVLTRTRFGLRLRAVGDDEQVAVLRGISPPRHRAAAALVAGAFGGLGGAAIPLASIGSFSPGMTGGAGFVALAVVIIARRRVLGLLLGAFMFAAFHSLALLGQSRALPVPVELLQALPYLGTLAVLCLVSLPRHRRRPGAAVPRPA